MLTSKEVRFCLKITRKSGWVLVQAMSIPTMKYTPEKGFDSIWITKITLRKKVIASILCINWPRSVLGENWIWLQSIRTPGEYLTLGLARESGPWRWVWRYPSKTTIAVLAKNEWVSDRRQVRKILSMSVWQEDEEDRNSRSNRYLETTSVQYNLDGQLRSSHFRYHRQYGMTESLWRLDLSGHT